MIAVKAGTMKWGVFMWGLLSKFGSFNRLVFGRGFFPALLSKSPPRRQTLR
jgi:hypothetical protein